MCIQTKWDVIIRCFSSFQINFHVSKTFKYAISSSSLLILAIYLRICVSYYIWAFRIWDEHTFWVANYYVLYMHAKVKYWKPSSYYILWHKRYIQTTFIVSPIVWLYSKFKSYFQLILCTINNLNPISHTLYLFRNVTLIRFNYSHQKH